MRVSSSSSVIEGPLSAAFLLDVPNMLLSLLLYSLMEDELSQRAALLRLSALKASEHSPRSENPPLPVSIFARLRPYHKTDRMQWTEVKLAMSAIGQTVK